MLRATLKSMLSRKVRLILSMIAVVLGVMFVSGAFVLNDTLKRSFEGLFDDIYEYTEISVSKSTDAVGLTGQPVPVPIPASDVDRVKGVPGVAKATGSVFTDGARLLDRHGKAIPSTGGPRFGGNWTPSPLISVREGKPPAADDEVMISANLAKTTGFKVGDTVEIITSLQTKKTPYRLVGIVGYSGGRDSLAGETSVFFTERVAQQVMLGATGVYNTIEVDVADGSDQNAVKQRIQSALGSNYKVQTGDELSAESSEGIADAFSIFTYIFLGFAIVALVVGAFLILNTFFIIVAQRTRELALFRAMGASKDQVIVSVLIEAAVIGFISSVIGLALGIGVGILLGLGLGSLLSGGALELAGFGVPPVAVISAFAVGIGITLIAALLPAILTMRIAPVAAMRESAITDKPLTKLTLIGLGVFAVGATALGLGLGDAFGDFSLRVFLGGLLVSFIGVALLTPIIARPVVSGLGRLLSRSASGDLGRRNSARNPRRTAITAAALMVSVAIVTAISVIFSSIQASTVEAIDTGLNAELVIAADPLSGGIGSLDPAVLDEVRDLPEVASAVGVYADIAMVDGNQEFLGAIDDPRAGLSIFKLEPVSGSITNIGPGQAIVDDKTAADHKLTAGSTITVRMSRGDVKSISIVGVFKASALVTGFYLSAADVANGFSNPAPIQAFVDLTPNANVDSAYAKVQDVLQDSPEVTVSKVDDFVAAQAQLFSIILVFVQILLGLAMIIAVLGVINTLALSMSERTREVGLLRAVGMKRGQVMWMVTVESVVICVFGALLGIAVGVGLGTTVFQALRNEGFSELAFPWGLMAAYVVASVIVGLIAGLIPALRAARQDVLRAIAYE